jgi:hypothetical protein
MCLLVGLSGRVRMTWMVTQVDINYSRRWPHQTYMLWGKHITFYLGRPISYKPENLLKGLAT